MDITVPIIVIILDKASLKLFTASDIIAIELEINPIDALNPANTILDIILIILVFTTIFSLLSFILYLPFLNLKKLYLMNHELLNLHIYHKE